MLKVWIKFLPLIIFLSFFGFYLFFQSQGIFGGDSGDLVSAAYVWGIPHPPGYPLYTFTGAILIRLIPLFTPAWRVSLLSSFCSALSLVFWFLIIKKIVKSRVIAFVSILTLGLSYIFWLYALVPEVFGLHSLLVSILVFLLLNWYDQPTNKKFYLFIFFLGLSLSHHHTTFLLLPAFVYLLTKHKNFFKKPIKILPRSIGLFLLGLVPYLYLPLVGQTSPAIDWAHPVTVKNFWALVSRSIYGSLSSFHAAAQEALLRLFQLPNYFFFIILNISFFGLILAILGVLLVWRKNRTLFNFLFLAFFFTGPFFMYYASYPLVNPLLLGTFERFLLLSLPFIIIFLSVGIKGLVDSLAKYYRVFYKYQFLLPYVFLIIPVILIKSSLWKMLMLKTDLFSQRLGIDILNTAQPNSILILSADQPLFNSQYDYYALGYRKDLILIHDFLLRFDYYRQYLKKTYPDISVPNDSDRKLFLKNFLKDNSQRFPIFINFEDIEGGWLEPIGLLYKYHASKKTLPSNEEVLAKNTKIWSGYQDLTPLLVNPDYHSYPLSVIDIYRQARVNLCRVYLEGGLYTQALEQCGQAQKLKDKNDSYLLAGTALTKLGRCGQAQDNFQKVILAGTTPKDEVYNLLYLNAAYCWKIQDKIDHYKKLWEETKKEKDQKVK